MSVFVDTSALYALLDEDDANHQRAAAIWPDLLIRESLVTNTYVVVEATALIQLRLGRSAAEQLHDDILPVLRIEAVDDRIHLRALERWRSRRQGDLSLVDSAAIVMMEEPGFVTAFSLDSGYLAAGFRLVSTAS